jgi:type IV pilus assembly protein PilY1
LGGGYDTNQDLVTPAATDTKGAAIFAVDVSNGNLLSSLLTFTQSNLSSMNHSIVDLIAYDGNGDGYTDSIYAGDMGGQVFALKADKSTGAWSGRKMFQAGDGTSSTAQMKFFYAPDIATQGYTDTSVSPSVYSVYDYVFIGTGDREHPNSTAFNDRFYAVKNKNSTTVVTESDANLIDVTSYSTGYASPHNISFITGNTSDGWFIRLGYNDSGVHVRPGEKVVSSPIVYNGVVYFTTFTPTPAAAGDLCSNSGSGQAFLYAVNYLTGEAAFNWNTANDTTDSQGKPKAVYDESDRHFYLGQYLPPAPKLTVTSSGPVLIIWDQTIPLPQMQNIKQYYWIRDN